MPPEAPPHLRNDVDTEICGDHAEAPPVRRNDSGMLEGTLVWLESPQPLPAYKSTTRKSLRVQSCQLTPRIVVVGMKEELQIENHDPINYDLQFKSQAQRSRSRHLPPNLKFTSVNFDRPDFLQIQCFLHTPTKGFIMVAAHPFYAVTDAKGVIRFSQIPNGEYQLFFWHERLGKRRYSQKIRLQGGTLQMKLRWEDLKI